MPRPEYAKLGVVLLAFAAIAYYRNVMTKPQYLVTFLQYFIPALLIILPMLLRKDIMDFIVNLMQSLSKNYKKYTLTRQRSLYRSLKKLYEQDFVFFSKVMI